MRRRRDGVLGCVAYELHAGILIKPGQMRSASELEPDPALSRSETDRIRGV